MLKDARLISSSAKPDRSRTEAFEFEFYEEGLRAYAFTFG
ncbi:hypothetical protein BQ8794_690002 [Mesorhizobium prunaredense]|uniref:Uncharacterized protein n=2 Tax=Mesorhizobium prunaredense TaxID=1631249 RepID=A0A1R3VKW0_9HYPH|nr:hypothetical protein BQ8794_690002 [Mesorhizobium prunaredense]